MNAGRASTRTLWLLPVGAILVGCARVDSQPELRQAARHVGDATGTSPAWLSDALLELQPDAAGTVTVDYAVDLALANNRSLRADREVIGQAKADLVQAGLIRNPVFSIMVRFPDSGGRSMIDFGLVQDFADLWLIPSRKQAAQAMLQERLLSLSDTAIALVGEVKSTYHLHQFQAVAIELQEQNRGILREAIEIAEARLRGGQAGQLDVNLLQTRLLETELELLQLRSDFQVTRQSLLRLMGAAQVTVTWQPTPLPLDSAAPALPDVEQLVGAALDRRLDVRAADWELRAAAAQFHNEMLKMLPSFSLGIAGERKDRRGILPRKYLAETVRASVAAGKLTVPQFQTPSERRLERNNEIDFLLGPSLDIPLPIFDQNQAQVAKAQYRVRELRQRYEELEQRVIEGVRSAALQQELADQKVRFYRESLLPLAQANLRLAETAYQTAQEPILTVLLAQEEFIRTRLAHAAAVRDMYVNTAILERQMGGRIPPETLTPTTQPAADEENPDERPAEIDRARDRPRALRL